MVMHFQGAFQLSENSEKLQLYYLRTLMLVIFTDIFTNLIEFP